MLLQRIKRKKILFRPFIVVKAQGLIVVIVIFVINIPSLVVVIVVIVVLALDFIVVLSMFLS